MRNSQWIVLAFLVCIMMSGVAAAARTAEVGPNELGVHKRASAESPVLTRLMTGQKVVVESEASGWCRISVAGGKKPIGYVPCEDLKAPSAPQPAASLPPASQQTASPSQPAGPRPYSDITVRLYMADW